MYEDARMRTQSYMEQMADAGGVMAIEDRQRGAARDGGCRRCAACGTRGPIRPGAVQPRTEAGMEAGRGDGGGGGRPAGPGGGGGI
mmetsp:Transcript_105423/g.304324  ORF Transcript_105423/g.304324 Transcript_105423/m.304324 type:complete len:86 (+) Transcript_105423:199-456(+)